MSEEDEGGGDGPAGTACAHCGRLLGEDPDWLWWRPVDAEGEVVLYCGECVPDDARG